MLRLIHLRSKLDHGKIRHKMKNLTIVLDNFILQKFIPQFISRKSRPGSKNSLGFLIEGQVSLSESKGHTTGSDKKTILSKKLKVPIDHDLIVWNFKRAHLLPFVYLILATIEKTLNS